MEVFNACVPFVESAVGETAASKIGCSS